MLLFNNSFYETEDLINMLFYIVPTFVPLMTCSGEKNQDSKLLMVLEKDGPLNPTQDTNNSI